MFSSPVLDLVILLSFIYFIGSLILSTINEAIAGTFRLRPLQLETSLQNLFFDDNGAWKTWVDKTLKTNPNIQSLMKSTDKFPSYIPASNFVLAVITQLRAGDYKTGGDLQAAITASGLPPVFQKVLADLALQANNDFASFQKSLEGFYNNAMDRAGGIYKRKIRLILLIVGFIAASFLNLDTIQIVQQELSSPAKLSQTADQISKEIPKIKLNKDSVETVSVQTTNGTISVDHKVDVSKKAGTDIKQVHDLTVYLGQTSGYNLGYPADNSFMMQWFCSGPLFLEKLLGVLITAFALQLSSSFWFDLMSKAVNVRAAGNKPKTGTNNSNSDSAN